jgi:hypothetical protein
MNDFKYVYVIDENSPPPEAESYLFFVDLDFGTFDCEYKDGETTALIKFKYKHDYDRFVEHINSLRKFDA